ncbi:MAG: hypothetical protein WCL21_18930 [Mariniphaga sp.]
MTFPAELTTGAAVHAVAPALPPIVKVTTPAGAAAFTAPVTVALKIALDPRVRVAGVSEIAIVGVALLTTIAVEDTGATGKKAVSPGKVKIAV